jgi:hypothetical protein
MKRQRGLGLIAIALLTMSPALSRAEDELGQLFSSGVERARIDEARRLSRLPPPPPAPEPEAVIEPPAPPPPPPAPVRQQFSLDGVVLRSQGPTTVWVNGESSTGGPLLGAAASIAAPARPGAPVRIDAEGGSILLLKPGQVADTEGLQPAEAYLQMAEEGEAEPVSRATPGSPVTRPGVGTAPKSRQP